MKIEENSSDNKSHEDLANKETIGALLTAARIARNEDLSGVSSNLRIRQVYIEAIENDDFNSLPGDIYVIGFIRSYSTYLNLNAEEVIARYKSEISNPKTRPDLVFPTYVPENGIPGGAILLLGLLIAILAYGSWYFLFSRNNTTNNQISNIPNPLNSLNVDKSKIPTQPIKSKIKAPNKDIKKERIKRTEENTIKNDNKLDQNKTEVKEETASGDGPDINQKKSELEVVPSKPFESRNPTQARSLKSAQIDEPKPPKIDEPKPHKIEELTTSVTTSPKTKSKIKLELKSNKINKTEPIKKTIIPGDYTNKRKVQQSAVNQDQLPQSKPSKIILEALSDSYIQVRDNDANQLLITKLLKKGQTYNVPDRPGLTLITGNAGALRILVEGIEAPKIGPIGAIRRNVLLDVVKLRNGSAVVE
tara:strand:- start:687 stop:1943 length:1257 start_codon:yes stop_codon:yes gene_type:complete